MNKALRAEALRLCRMNWDVLRRYNGKRGPDAMAIRRAALQSLQAIYATEVGQGIGALQRWVVAGMLWPAGKDE